MLQTIYDNGTLALKWLWDAYGINWELVDLWVFVFLPCWAVLSALFLLVSSYSSNNTVKIVATFFNSLLLSFATATIGGLLYIYLKGDPHVPTRHAHMIGWIHDTWNFLNGGFLWLEANSSLSYDMWNMILYAFVFPIMILLPLVFALLRFINGDNLCKHCFRVTIYSLLACAVMFLITSVVFMIPR